MSMTTWIQALRMRKEAAELLVEAQELLGESEERLMKLEANYRNLTQRFNANVNPIKSRVARVEECVNDLYELVPEYQPTKEEGVYKKDNTEKDLSSEEKEDLRRRASLAFGDDALED